MDPHFLSRILGQKIIITLTCGSFQGVLQHVDPSRAILLSRVKDMETGLNLPGVKLFFGYEIVNVELLNEDLVNEAEQGAVTENPMANRGVQSEEMTKKNKDSLIAQNEDPASNSAKPQNTSWSAFKHDIAGREEEVEYMVIDHFQQTFGPAIRHIKSQNVIGIAAEGASLCRHGKLCWLQVATRNKVYLFDVFTLGAPAFKNGLQMVFEDKGILKVIHDCRWLSDCLSHQYGIVFTNVFDTQVADVFIFSAQTGGFLPQCISTLKDLLVQHLGISPSQAALLKSRQRLIQDEPDIWFVRPIPPHLLKVLALEAVFLLPLRSVLLDEMMSDYTSLVDGYLNTYRQGGPNLLGSTQFSCMKLPEQLRQLTVWQKLRRKKASKEFQMGDDGLLMRPNDLRLQKTSSHKDMHGCVQTFLQDYNKQRVCNEHPSFEMNVPANKSVASQEKSYLEDQSLPKWEETVENSESQLPEGTSEANFSLQKQMGMMVLDNETRSPCMKRNMSDYYSSDATINLKGSFQALKTPMTLPLPPCPSLENYSDFR